MKLNISKISLILLIISLLSCSKTENNQEEKQEEKSEFILKISNNQLKNSNIKVGNLELKSLGEILKVNGIIEVPPRNKVSISTTFGGFLKKSDLLEGTYVKKGQVLAIIENQEFIQIQQDYLLAKAKINFLEQDLQRQRELNKEKAVSDKSLQMVQSEYNSQKVLLYSSAEKLKMIGINTKKLSPENIQKNVIVSSPINGYVTKVYANIGKFVGSNDILFDIIDISDVHLTLNVFEKDINNLKIGQKVTAYTNNSNQKYNAEIILISKEISVDRSVLVHCHFTNYNPSLFSGMYMNAEIETFSHSSLAIPEESVVIFQGKNYIFIQKDNLTYKMVLVEIDLKENGFVSIKNSQKLEQNKIVVKNAYTLLMMLKNSEEEEE